MYDFSKAPITAYSTIAMTHSKRIDMSSQFILKRRAGILISYDIYDFLIIDTAASFAVLCAGNLPDFKSSDL